MLRECPSIFSAEGDSTLNDSYSETTFFVPTAQKTGVGEMASFLVINKK
jgi:hypothetical protein